MNDHDPTRLPPPAIDTTAATAAAERFAAEAAERGDADVAYAQIDSPVGRLVAAATPAGLAMLSYEDFRGGLDAVLDTLAARLSPRIVAAPRRLDPVKRELDEYFAGTRTTFDLALDWTLTSDFARRILQATVQIPFGATASYGEMAAAAGNPKASRAAGRALGSNPIPIVVPCHRIIGTSGRLTGYTGGIDRKIKLLEVEGISLG
ncbi:Methylated-DNA--protein-cysteine methyltransferase [Paraconexibacter sp. AEG42_29]|uniref:Methylated-DNA--protein-cysteine methyltransferase n=1 Tax=Paraconexibacter sp. AEG42_29 TaxID=2997339 RepID=A0AAU7AXW5_9ACTN